MNRSRRLQKDECHGRCERAPQLAGIELSDDDLDKVAGAKGLVTSANTIHFATNTEGEIAKSLKHELDNVRIGSYSVSSGADLPVETISLKFPKLTETFNR